MNRGLIRAGSRKGVRDKKTAAGEKRTGRLPEPSVCERCGAVFARRTWRLGRRLSGALLDRARWTKCPACKQAGSGEYRGRVVVRGAIAAEQETAIRRRVANVDALARMMQPERRVVSAERDGAVFEVLTTSQKLAHRIARELKKAFGGRVAYKWSDDGSLFAVWRRD